LFAVTAGATAAPPPLSFSQAAYTVATFAHGSGSGIGGGSADKPIAIADMNGDGKPDIVASDYQASKIYVLLNNGDGTFPSTPITNPAGCTTPDSLLVHDFNGDGKQDVLMDCAPGGGDTIVLMAGDGHGGLSPTTTNIAFGQGPMFIGNIDGDTDVAYNTYQNGFAMCTIDIENFAQPGSLDSFKMCPGYREWGSTVHFYTGACGGDEWMDLTPGSTSTSNYNVSIISAQPDPDPLKPCDYTTNHDFDSGISPNDALTGLAAADLNGDGIPDVVASANPDSGPGEFHVAAGLSGGTVSGSLSGPTTIASTANITAFGLADFNGDGYTDIAGAEWSNPTNPFSYQTMVAVHQVQGDTVFGPQTIPISSSPSTGTGPEIAVGDLNGDGKPDIITSASPCNADESSCATQITVLLDTTPAAAGGGGGGGGTGGGGGGTGGGGGGGGLNAVTLAALHATALKFHIGNALVHFTRSVPIGTTISFSVNRAARVKYTFLQLAAGKRSGRLCVALKPRLRHARSCTRRLRAGVLSFTASAGTHKLFFDGRLSRRKTLRPGRYELDVTATANGLTSRPQELLLTLLPPIRH
jgi:hypothetical protein